jgi:hypothetical protein
MLEPLLEKTTKKLCKLLLKDLNNHWSLNEEAKQSTQSSSLNVGNEEHLLMVDALSLTTLELTINTFGSLKWVIE